MTEGKATKVKKSGRMFLFLPLKGFLPYVGLIAGILIIIFQKSFWSYSEGIVGRILIDIVRFETRGKYTIEYEKVRFNVWNDQLRLTNFSVIQDKDGSISKVEKNEDFALKSSLLSLKVNSFFDILINREIQIEGLDLVKPSLRIVRNKSLENVDTVQIESSKIIELVTQYLNDFKIKELKVENAKLEYIEQMGDSLFTIKLADVSLEINQFEVLNPLRQNETIRSNHFEFELLNDSIDLFQNHLITFDRIKGTSSDSLIRVENLAIIPESGNTSNMNLDVKLLFAEINGFDPRDILNEDTLQLDKFKFGNGHIHLVLPNSAKKRVKKTGIEFPDIQLSSIDLKNIDFNLEFPIENVKHQIGLKGLNIETSPVVINESSIRSVEEILKNVDIDLKAKEYSIDLAGIEHRVKLNNLVLNVGDGYFSADRIEVNPYSSSGSKYKSSLRNIQIWGLNFGEAIVTQNLEIRKVLIRGLDLNVFHDPNINNSSKKVDLTNIYPLVRNIFPSVQVGDLQIRDSNILYKNLKYDSEVILDNISLALHDILIDSLLVLNPKQILGAEDISLGGNAASLNLKGGAKEIATGPFTLSTISKILQVNDAQYISYYPSSEDIGVSSIYASGINWFDLLHGKDLILDTLLVMKPKVVLDKLDTLYIPTEDLIYTSSPDFLDSLNIGHISVDDGELDIRDYNNVRVRLTAFYSQIEDIKVVKREEKIFWQSYNFYGKSGPFSIAMNNDNHIVSGNGIAISKYDSTLRLNQLKIVPIDNSLKGGKADILVPNVIVTGINLLHLLDSNLIITDRTLLINPRVTFLSSKTDLNRRNPIQEEIDDDSGIRFTSNEISIMNAFLNLNYGDSVSNQITTDWFDMNIKGLIITPEIRIDSDLNFFEDLNFEAKGFAHSSLPMIDTIYIDRLVANANTNLKAYDITGSGRDDQLSYGMLIPEIGISSKYWLRKILKEDFSFDTVLIINPKINIDFKDISSVKKKKREPSKLTISDLKLDSGSIDLTFNENYFHIPDFSLDVDQLDLTKEAEEFFSTNLSIRAGNLENLFPESYSTVDIQEITLSTANQTLNIQGLVADPKFSKLEYGKELGFQTDWMNVEVENINLKGIDYAGLIKNGSYFMREALVDGLNLTIYRDKNIPFPEDQVRYMPQKMIADIKDLTTIESIIVENANIRYEELIEGASEAGYIDLLNLNAGISNISNDSSVLIQNPIMRLASNFDLMGSGNMQADFEFDMKDPDGKHTYRAYLSEMPIEDLNKILEPNVNVHIKSGDVTKMTMQVEGNSDYSIGSMRFLYENLHFNLVGKKSGSTSKMGPAMGSFFANTFIVNRNNPRLLLVRTGGIYFERDTTKSILNYITKTALSGVVSSIGARNNRKFIKKVNKESQEDLERRKKRQRIKRDQALTTKED